MIVWVFDEWVAKGDWNAYFMRPLFVPTRYEGRAGFDRTQAKHWPRASRTSPRRRR